MNLSHVIEAAAEALGGKKQLAAAMGKQPARISEWLSGERKPDAHEVAFMAQCAGLPVLETVAEIEAQLDERYASIWRAALGKLRAAGVAAAVVGSVVMAALSSPGDAYAASRDWIERVPLRQLRRLLRRLGFASVTSQPA